VLSINLSASALSDDGLMPLIERELAHCELPPDTLCFEVAESSALANPAGTVRLLSAIRRIGCGTALEDIGSGMASFSSLKTLPVDFLKIGGRFVQEVAEDPMSASIVKAVNQIGRSMGISTIAKQVSSMRVLRKLRALRVNYAQGHAINPPMPLCDSEGRVVLPRPQESALAVGRAQAASHPFDGDRVSIL
jgi:EAL domain-containing protein (putative c-di-GMP-specific phosphodiesterase class I)